MNRRVKAKFANIDIKGGIRELASCEGHAPQSAEMTEALKAKHPAAPPDLNLLATSNGELATPVVLSEHSVLIAVNLFFHLSRLRTPMGSDR